MRMGGLPGAGNVRTAADPAAGCPPQEVASSGPVVGADLDSVELVLGTAAVTSPWLSIRHVQCSAQHVTDRPPGVTRRLPLTAHT